MTAALVCWPNTPSTVSLAPWAFSRYCSERIVTIGHMLFGPCCRTGHGCRAGAWTVADIRVAPGAADGPLDGKAAIAPAPAAPVASTAVTAIAVMVVFVVVFIDNTPIKVQI